MPEQNDPKRDGEATGTGPSGHEVGTAGERFIEELWRLPFGRDFLFANPKYKKGKNEREVCDLLLLLDEYAVVVQIKTADPTSKSGWDEQKWADWGNAKAKEALKQLKGGLRAMLDGRAPAVENDRQGRVEIDPTKLTHLFGIVVVDSPALDHWGVHPVVEVGGRSVPVLQTSHQNMIEIVTELSTPMDLINYLGMHARFFEKHKLHGVTELDLLAAIKTESETFDRADAEDAKIIVLPGTWQRFQKGSLRQHRAALDRNSFVVDAMANKLHLIHSAEPDFVREMRAEDGRPEPDRHSKQQSINQLARLGRLDRRHVGNKLFEKSQLCLKTDRNRHFVFRPGGHSPIWHVYLVSLLKERKRLEYLSALCSTFLVAYGHRQVYGYAIDPVMVRRGFRVDTVWIQVDPAEIRTGMKAEEIEQARRYFTMPQISYHTEFGGPEAPPTTLPLDPGDWLGTVS